MSRLLLSINPRHVERILAGAKRFEFRKARCRKAIDSILIYSTAPVKMIVAEAALAGILEDTPRNLWRMTSAHAGVDQAFFARCFAGKSSAVAYVLGTVTRFPRPRPLGYYGIRVAPQSYAYVD